MTPTIDSKLFWLLPGPRSLGHKIATQILRSRALIINLPKRVVPGIREAIDRGLRDAQLADPILLNIGPHSNISADVAAHMSGAGPLVTAEQLASFNLTIATPIVLAALDDDAQMRCERYVTDFIRAIKSRSGNVHLITTINDSQHKADANSGQIQVLVFDGGLTPDEMDAYVALRMADRPGPGSTRLLRALVSEFAGFDVQFAERLIALDDSHILGVKDHLGSLLGEDVDRWRTMSWLSGTMSNVCKDRHVLYDQYLREHGTKSDKETANAAINRRYWRACLKAITPWLEERRVETLQAFMPQLHAIAANASNRKIAVPAGKSERSVDPEELEYSNILGMVYSRQLKVNTSGERAVVEICRLVKPVRDSIAHLRPPTIETVTALIQGMDSLIP